MDKGEKYTYLVYLNGKLCLKYDQYKKETECKLKDIVVAYTNNENNVSLFYRVDDIMHMLNMLYDDNCSEEMGLPIIYSASCYHIAAFIKRQLIDEKFDEFSLDEMLKNVENGNYPDIPDDIDTISMMIQCLECGEYIDNFLPNHEEETVANLHTILKEEFEACTLRNIRHQAVEFNKSLRRMSLNQTQFCEMYGVTMQGVAKWKRTAKYPVWVKRVLDLD